MTDADVAALDAAVEDDVDQLESLDSASRSQQLQVGEIFIGVSWPSWQCARDVPFSNGPCCRPLHNALNARMPAGTGEDKGFRDSE